VTTEINIPQGPFLDPSTPTGVSKAWIQYLRDLATSADGTIPAGQAGAVIGYTSGGLAASLPLADNQIVLGGGTVPPETLGTLGASNLTLHGNAAGEPSFELVNLETDITGTLPVANGGFPGAFRIVIIGDSLTAQNFTLHDAWPAVFQRTMNAADAPCTVVNLAIDGCTYYRALQAAGYAGPTNYKFGTNTPVQEAIAQVPNLLFVMLGFNDAITAVDSRTLTQVESDATLTHAALRTGLNAAGLTATPIIYISELPYDNVNFTVTASTSNVETKGVVPYLFQPNTSGITANSYCTEALNNTLSSASNTLLEHWFSLDATIKALNSAAGVDAFFTMWYWRIARLGCLGPDVLHPTAAGSILEQGYIMKGIVNTPILAALFPKLVNQNYPVWNDPDFLFGELLASTGGNGYYYISDGSIGDEWITQNGSRQQIHPYDETWFLPYHTVFSLTPNTKTGGPPNTYSTTVSNDNSSMFTWTVERGPPISDVMIAIDGAASFSPLNNYTTSEGYANATASGYGAGLAVGTHTIRYQLITGSGASEIYGPFTFIVSNPALAGQFTTLTLSQTTGTAPMTISSNTVVNNLNAQFCNGFSFTGGASGSSTGTQVLTGKPGSNSTSGWASITTTGGAVFYFLAWT
jgi:lysophospholipase L1-like esterase